MMLHVGSLSGRIERRLLINFRADPGVIASILPEPFRPQLVGGPSIVGICVVRLAAARPSGLPSWLGVHAEHVAHRIAVTIPSGEGTEVGVFIPRRDTSSKVVAIAGSRYLSGGLHRAFFSVAEGAGRYRVELTSKDHQTDVAIDAAVSEALPATSVLANLAASSAFFENGSIGYSTGATPDRFDGVALSTNRWSVTPLTVATVRSSDFHDRSRFPSGSIEFDHALVMTDVETRWSTLPPLSAPRPEASAAA